MSILVQSKSWIKIKLDNGVTRWLGILRGDLFYIHRDRKKHLFKKYNGYGLNKELMVKAKENGLFSKVHLDEVAQEDLKIVVNTYMIPIEDVVTLGIEVKYDKKGFESQIVLPLNLLEQYKVKKEEDGERKTTKTLSS